MQELLTDLCIDPSRKRLVLMPLTRLVFDQPFTVGAFHFFPPGSVDLKSLRPITNKTLDSQFSTSGVTLLEGQSLREVATSMTGFCIDTLEKAPVVAFTEEINWDKFLNSDHDADINLIQKLASKAERALDIIRFDYCRFDLPYTLPGLAGSWEGSGEYLGALLYTPEDHESYLIAGAVIECSVITRGLGLKIDAPPSTPLPTATDGEVAAIALHGLALYSDAMNAPNETIKFVRVMTLLEFLASPDEYQNWKKLKGEIACHCAKDKTSYHALCERFRELTSKEDASAGQIGIRTRIVHHGKFLPELMPNAKDRASLFRELQGYCGVLIDMIGNASMSWAEYCNHRVQLKKKLGVV